MHVIGDVFNGIKVYKGFLIGKTGKDNRNFQLKKDGCVKLCAKSDKEFQLTVEIQRLNELIWSVKIRARNLEDDAGSDLSDHYRWNSFVQMIVMSYC